MTNANAAARSRVLVWYWRLHRIAFWAVGTATLAVAALGYVYTARISLVGTALGISVIAVGVLADRLRT